ncbi:uncharacterized protein LALA0_S09e03246g [Lachancea lanzarotensis]|uniref:LALA0S09e03246g1_1 n=1 Tax=Lachancea lanzarotensis TaxID=1245769 RepID=A0A0C7NBQ1_9SACH|nr:uncharacterized protein LALA0_S09e03246g [Lachancea lanzarotensis]CEP63820.1 LALA0S09e03246g1_1 [Lachancea lanzarotensis]
MISMGFDDSPDFEPRPSFRHKRAFSGPSVLTPSSTIVNDNSDLPPLQAEVSPHDMAERVEPMESQLNLHYPMATASRIPVPYEKPYTAQRFAFTTNSPSSLYNPADIYATGLESPSNFGHVQELHNGPIMPNWNSYSQWPVHTNREAVYSMPSENGRASFQHGSPGIGDFSNSETIQHPAIPKSSMNNYYPHISSVFPYSGGHEWETGDADHSGSGYCEPIGEDSKTTGKSATSYGRDNDFVNEEANDSDGDRQNSIPFQKRYFASSESSSSGLPPHTPQGFYANGGVPNNRRVSDSRLSAQGLAEVLNLNSAEEALRRERFILNIFERELHYPLGYKTWVRDTSKEYRTQLLDQLHRRVIQTYPEYDKPVLETIIRRATYYMMQSRLRRERRARAKQKRNQGGGKNGLKDTGVTDNFDLGFEHPTGFAGSAFVM